MPERGTSSPIRIIAFFELGAVFGFVNRFLVGADELDAVLVEDAGVAARTAQFKPV